MVVHESQFGPLHNALLRGLVHGLVHGSKVRGLGPSVWPPTRIRCDGGRTPGLLRYRDPCPKVPWRDQAKNVFLS